TCLNSGKGKIGDPCALILGMPDCGDGLVCLMAPGAPMGQCTPYCDPTNPAHACPNMESCIEVILVGTNLTFEACKPEGSGAGGMGGGGGGGMGGGMQDAGDGG